MSSGINFGYPWYFSYGHVIVIAVAALLWVAGRVRRWPNFLMIVIAAVMAWSVAGFVVARFMMNINGRATLPTQNFLPSGEGRVLDMGAGTGRSSLMVLEARPRTTLVALDLFADSFAQHFGPGQSGQERLLANLKAAGVDQRVTIETGDMRKLPFAAASFDAVVSSYAVDHLRMPGITASLSEAARVLKPKGQFLLMVIGNDYWLQFTFGPLLLHSNMRTAATWNRLVREAGFEVLEEGTRPATLYWLARKP